MTADELEALLADLEAYRTQADVLRWQMHIYLHAVRQNRQRLARQIRRAGQGWQSVRDGETDERRG
jgi:hypothetical protein